LDFDPKTITEEEYKSGFYYAEILTIRGWAYAALQRFFCKRDVDLNTELSIPIYTEEATKGDSILGAPRATASDVYLRVEEDLLTAIDYFKAFSDMERNSKLETNIDVARMTLAYSYLNKGEYENALNIAKDLIDNTEATILPNAEVLTNGFNNVDSKNWIWGQNVTIETTTALASFFGQCDIYSYSYASAGDVKGIDNKLLAKITELGWDIRENWWGNYYREDTKNNSMYNTPPCYTIYICGKVFKWLKAQGGLEAMRERNVSKAALLYDFLDQSKLFKSTVDPKDRSIMNIPFVTGSSELDAEFIAAAKAAGMENLKGHRSVGGMRASIYNAMPRAGVEKLVTFMEDFEKKHA
jgi:tetratricopeptide (TPR) repeat protein